MPGASARDTGASASIESGKGSILVAVAALSPFLKSQMAIDQ